MDLDLTGLKGEELAALEHTTRHMEPDHLRSRAAYQLGIALKEEIRERMQYTLANRAKATVSKGRHHAT